MDQLKPCPFCGGEVSIVLTGRNGFENWLITRSNTENRCTCRVFMESNSFLAVDSGAKEKEELIQKWNTRAETNNILLQLEDLLNTSIDVLERSAYIRAMRIVKTGGKE